ncbi:MAG: radical SAM protein [Oscillospiraceae bacterium]
MDITKNITRFALDRAFNYLEKDPEKNMPKLMSWVDRFSKNGFLEGQRNAVRKIVNDPENIWYRYICDMWTDIDPGVLRTIFDNFIINANITGTPLQEEARKKYACNIPWAILMDPTSACNLKCTGCWAAEYDASKNLNIDMLDSIIKQGKQLGIYMYIYSGGEPLVRKSDIISLCEKHADCQFLAFTNGTLIDENFADDMLRVGNFIPAISVEGFEKDTDFRRGEGTFARVTKAMAILRERKLPFGISCCYTRYNAEMIGSEAYYDAMIAWGAKFCWFFTYMPVGKDAVPELIATAEQREYMYNQVRKFRQTKPLFTIDFWNDGEFVGGCIAGGRSYLHINANGDVEPCAFIHYADTNIRQKTLIEALQSPLFAQYRKNQPFNENHLRPCPLLDNPGRLTDMVIKSGAASTDMKHPEDVRELSDKCVHAAACWAETADRLWACSRCKEPYVTSDEKKDVKSA